MELSMRTGFSTFRSKLSTSSFLQKSASQQVFQPAKTLRSHLPTLRLNAEVPHGMLQTSPEKVKNPFSIYSNTEKFFLNNEVQKTLHGSKSTKGLLHYPSDMPFAANSKPERKGRIQEIQ